MLIHKIMFCAGLLACSTAVHAQRQQPDPVGILSYSLPATSIVLEVEAVQENFYAGPYAKFAGKYLGIDVRQEDSRTYTISQIRVTPYAEADHSSRYLLEAGNADVYAAFLNLTSEGLVAGSDGNFGNGAVWRFPAPSHEDFSDKGITSNLTSEDATLYHSVKNESAYTQVAVKQEIIVEKSIEKRAAETAAMIFDIREKRYQIVTGDTDATYSGQAMASAVEELTRLEKDYMSMFTGYSDYSSQTMTFEVVPQKDRENQLYVAFRISDTAGLLPADNLSGKPVILELVPQPVEPVSDDSGRARKPKGDLYVHYRIPAICTVKISDGMDVLYQGRVPVYQLGVESTYPVNVEVR